MTAISFELLSCLSLFQPTVHVWHFRSTEGDGITWPSDDPCLSDAKQVLQWCQDQGVQVLYPGHSDYPAEFFSLEDPPLFLSCRGPAAWKGRLCLSVVGSRDPSPQALDWMELYLMRYLKRNRMISTVSGGARGVDQKAHAISLRAQLPTVVFLPSGLAKPFPSEMRDWQSEILSVGGCLISEFAPTQDVRKHHFVKRNRMIAALSRVLFIVEARRRSGSTLTARLAREHSRTLCVLPGFPSDPRMAGTVDLLFDGAFPIRDDHDLETLVSLTSAVGDRRLSPMPGEG